MEIGLSLGETEAYGEIADGDVVRDAEGIPKLTMISFRVI